MRSLFSAYAERLRFRRLALSGSVPHSRHLFAAAAVFLSALPAHAQEPLTLEPSQRWRPSNMQQDCQRRAAACVAVDGAGGESMRAVPDAEQLQRRNLALIVGSTMAVGLYGQRKWWRDGFTSEIGRASCRERVL